MYVRGPDTKTFFAEAWPNNCTFMDFLNENA
jgi:alpha-glucosidase (family GH31 glycosyl hydrolase)